MIDIGRDGGPVTEQEDGFGCEFVSGRRNSNF